jgi:cytosine/adenosine deaminase-related metal-dependent hydrolase
LILRPYGIVIAGRLELGLELVVGGGKVEEIRPHTGIPENYVISAGFVNAHSHLEYRGLQGRLPLGSYWTWIRELTRLKQEQSDDEVRQDCLQAARENAASGVLLIGEHSDRPFAAEALVQAGIGGVVFQELITFFERESPREKIAVVEKKAGEQRATGLPVHLTPHALYTVDEATLCAFGGSGQPISVHLAETEHETAFAESGQGVIAEFQQSHGFDVQPRGMTAFALASELGLVREGAQLVHCCDLREEEIGPLAASGATVAHCPRSNLALNTPRAPIREMLDAGVRVGLGLDSPASSGVIDMFDEMRAALLIAEERARPIRPEEVWLMATGMGAAAIPGLAQSWDVAVGFESANLIAISVPAAHTVEDLIRNASPHSVSRLRDPQSLEAFTKQG